MCGISGFTGKPDQSVLEKMSRVLHRRGPDEEGFYSNGRINLGFQRLSILDLAKGNQPIHNEDKTLWSVLNGEIYNYADLRQTLIQNGHRLYTEHADSELIVHLYEMYGKDFIHKMNGMFAFALWDDQEKKLILSRDRMGVKPLFYAEIEGEIVFSSEIKGILNYPKYSPSPNFEALYHYFSFKNIPAPLTAFKGIYSLLPGETIQFSKGKIEKERWWTLKFEDSEDLDESRFEKEILNLLEDSVRLRMQCDVPFGACLSGGLDSSLVVGLMTRFTSKPISTFALGYEDGLKNKDADIFSARKVSKFFNTEHHEYFMSSKELVEDIDNVINAFDQPFSGTISTYFLSKLIKKHVKVALTGDGSDEQFGSYLSHRLAQPMFYLPRLLNKIQNGINLTKEEENQLKPCDIDFLVDLYERSGEGEVAWRCNLYLQTDQDKQKLLTSNFLEKIHGAETKALVEGHFSSLTAKDPLNRILEMEWKTQLPDQILAFVDSLSMAHSVEMRSPFLDYRFVEYAASIPGGFKIRNGRVKSILKQAALSVLPEEIVDRPKEGFVLPVFDWMTQQMKDYNMDMLSAKQLKKHNFFDEKQIELLLKDYYSGNKANAGKIWNLMMFQVWWNNFFD